MAQKNDDEILAQYLLKGGKMLEKACPVCGCPLFEYKKKTFCVVCAEKRPEASAPAAPAPASQPSAPPQVSPTFLPAGSPEAEMLSRELTAALAVLCIRVKNDEDPDHNLLLMDAIKTGTEALLNLRQL